ncbi:hypothetical protein ACLOJK_018241 [Asimina triloba]
MINSERLIAMARKWHKLAAMGRKRISLSITNRIPNHKTCRKPATSKGSFVVYTTDGGRFSFPLAYLGSPIFEELLKMSEDEYGLPSDGPITLPCNSVFMNYIVSLIQSVMLEDVEKALLLSMANGRCSTSSSSCLPQLPPNQPVLVHGC